MTTRQAKKIYRLNLFADSRVKCKWKPTTLSKATDIWCHRRFAKNGQVSDMAWGGPVPKPESAIPVHLRKKNKV